MQRMLPRRSLAKARPRPARSAGLRTAYKSYSLSSKIQVLASGTFAKQQKASLREGNRAVDTDLGCGTACDCELHPQREKLQKLAFLHPLAPTQSEPRFLIAPLAVLLAFMAAAVLALIRFPPRLAASA